MDVIGDSATLGRRSKAKQVKGQRSEVRVTTTYDQKTGDTSRAPHQVSIELFNVLQSSAAFVTSIGYRLPLIPGFVLCRRRVFSMLLITRLLQGGLSTSIRLLAMANLDFTSLVTYKA